MLPTNLLIKAKNYQTGRENGEKYNIENYTGVDDLVIKFKINKELKTKMFVQLSGRNCLHNEC